MPNPTAMGRRIGVDDEQGGGRLQDHPEPQQDEVDDEQEDARVVGQAESVSATACGTCSRARIQLSSVGRADDEHDLGGHDAPCRGRSG